MGASRHVMQTDDALRALLSSFRFANQAFRPPNCHYSYDSRSEEHEEKETALLCRKGWKHLSCQNEHGVKNESDQDATSGIIVQPSEQHSNEDIGKDERKKAVQVDDFRAYQEIGEMPKTPHKSKDYAGIKRVESCLKAIESVSPPAEFLLKRSLKQ